MHMKEAIYRMSLYMLCLMCFFVVASFSGITCNNVEAGRNQIPEAVKEESVQPMVDANVNLVLVGTVLSDAGKSVAIFEDSRTNAQQFHELGDEMEYGRITKILKDKVFLVKNGDEVELKIGFGSGGGSFVEDHSQANESGGIDQSMTTNVMKPFTRDVDLSELEVNVSQIYEGGAEVLDVEEDGLLSKLGLQPGDIIRNINLRETDADLSFSEAISQDIESGKEQLRLELERNGEKKIIYNMFIQAPPIE